MKYYDSCQELFVSFSPFITILATWHQYLPFSEANGHVITFCQYPGRQCANYLKKSMPLGLANGLGQIRVIWGPPWRCYYSYYYKWYLPYICNSQCLMSYFSMLLILKLDQLICSCHWPFTGWSQWYDKILNCTNALPVESLTCLT